LSREGSLSCHTYCDTDPRFFRSHPKDRPIQSLLTTHERMWRMYSNSDPHGATDFECRLFRLPGLGVGLMVGVTERQLTPPRHLIPHLECLGFRMRVFSIFWLVFPTGFTWSMTVIHVILCIICFACMLWFFSVIVVDCYKWKVGTGV
jgi:hypothetical protein